MCGMGCSPMPLSSLLMVKHPFLQHWLIQCVKPTESTTVTVKDPPDVLDRQKCLDALAALRHAKWFQV